MSTGFTHETYGKETVDWYTPPWVFEKMGIRFDLDPCHPIKRIEWIPVDKTYNINDDGLRSEWNGNVWLNPPYGKYTKDWLKKLNSHGNGIALVFSRTDCAWFHDSVVNADSILFLKGRIKFVDGFGVSGGSGAGSGSMLVAWGKHNSDVLKSMSNLGFFVDNRKE